MVKVCKDLKEFRVQMVPRVQMDHLRGKEYRDLKDYKESEVCRE